MLSNVKTRFASSEISLVVLIATLATLMLITAPSAWAQQGTLASNEEVIEEVIVTGSRRRGISPEDIASPVDIIDAETLGNRGSSDISDLIRTLVPSFNVSDHPISGTSSLVRPPNLRGLGADHTLVLVNGKRRHRAANIPNFSGGINDGTQGPDISTIPVIALKNIEVLRDGAAAQYGADAIAGVMNFVANDNPEVRSIEVKAGQTYDGDGSSYSIAATFGIPLPNAGSLNLSGELGNKDRALRAQQSSGNQAFVDAGYTAIRNPAIIWGTPEVKDNIKLFANLVAPISDSIEIYGFASYNERENISGFFFRNPRRGGVFAIGDERIVFDTTEGGGEGLGSGNCPMLMAPNVSVSETNTAAVIAAAVAADLAAIEALRQDPNCYSFLEDFPGGTAPFFTGLNKDYQLSLGLRGEFGNGFSYDASYLLGENEVTYRTFDSFNPTYGPDSPNFLVAGLRRQKEQTLNAQVNYAWELGMASPLNIALGFEWHEEDYKQTPGQEEAYGVGPYTKTAQGTTGISVGTLGFGSFSPGNSFADKRNNTAVYIDAEGDITDKWTVGAAFRYEDFSDVGKDSNYKLSSLFHITDNLGVRGTLSTGFHAPTPGQIFFAQSTVGFNDAGVLTTSSALPVSIVGQLPSFADRAVPLKPETSQSIGAGLIWTADFWSLTVDFFSIKVKDRITLTSTFNFEAEDDPDTPDVNEAAVAAAAAVLDRLALTNAGITNADQFTGVSFFTNDFDTRTKGVDVIATIPINTSGPGTTEVNLAFNYTSTKVTRRGPNISDLRVLQLEQQLPKTKGTLSFKHLGNKFRVNTRLNYYGPLTEYYLSTTRLTNLNSQITVDLEGGYKITDALEFSVGGQNIFDSYPTEAVYADAFGSTYPVSSPAGITGGYYYAKVKYSF